MGEIRFLGTGETHGYPYLVCKKNFSIILSVRFIIPVVRRQQVNTLRLGNTVPYVGIQLQQKTFNFVDFSNAIWCTKASSPVNPVKTILNNLVVIVSSL